MSNLDKFDETTFDMETVNSDQPVLIDFYADWCGPCRAMSPVVESIASDLSGQLKVAKVDTDATPSLAMRYGIMSIPTLMVFHKGQVIDRLVGYPGPTTSTCASGVASKICSTSRAMFPASLYVGTTTATCIRSS